MRKSGAALSSPARSAAFSPSGSGSESAGWLSELAPPSNTSTPPVASLNPTPGAAVCLEGPRSSKRWASLGSSWQGVTRCGAWPSCPSQALLPRGGADGAMQARRARRADGSARGGIERSSGQGQPQPQPQTGKQCSAGCIAGWPSLSRAPNIIPPNRHSIHPHLSPAQPSHPPPLPSTATTILDQ
jgi:hypothetical protein